MARLTLALACSLAWAACAAAQETGAVAGVIRFVGDVPAAEKIPTSDGGFVTHRDLVVDAKTKGLRHVSVFVETGPKAKPREPGPVVVDQRDMLFLPRVVAVQEGVKVRFENNDLVNHAVQSFSTLPENVFNVTTPQGQPFEFAFAAQKAPVTIGCPIHGWMRAYVFVHPHPHFAVTGPDGRYRIEGLPPGEHFVVFRHPDTGLSERRTVTVAPGRDAPLDVEWRTTKR